jgi:hypothetical protein
MTFQLQFQKQFMKQQQKKSYKLKKEAQKEAKKARQLEQLNLALSVNQPDPVKLNMYWNQLDLLMICGRDPKATLHQTQEVNSDDDNRSDEFDSNASDASRY